MFDGGMSWGETWDLTMLLAADPSSQVGAAVAGWTHPLTREGMAALDLLDVTIQVNSKGKPRPVPRPWDVRPNRIGTTTLSQPEIRAALQARGHN